MEIETFRVKGLNWLGKGRGYEVSLTNKRLIISKKDEVFEIYLPKITSISIQKESYLLYDFRRSPVSHVLSILILILITLLLLPLMIIIPPLMVGWLIGMFVMFVASLVLLLLRIRYLEVIVPHTRIHLSGKFIDLLYSKIREQLHSI